MKKISILLLILITTLSSATAVQETPSSIIMPDSPLYDLKLIFEDIHEAVTLPIQDKLTLRQEHLQSRLNELQYEVRNNYNKNTKKLLQRIQIKQLEIEESLATIQSSCPLDACYVINKGFKENISEYRNYINNHGQEVITTLINNPSMPEQSRKGLENALNMTAKYQTRISANMVQGTYSIDPIYTSILPFTTIAVLDPNKNKWYTITIENDKIIILDYLSNDQPQYYIYPTSSQLQSFENIVKHINKNSLTIQDKIQIFKLWYSIKKVEVE